jgi:ABC-type lipoprotein export system ATPase subunit
MKVKLNFLLSLSLILISIGSIANLIVARIGADLVSSNENITELEFYYLILSIFFILLLPIGQNIFSVFIQSILVDVGKENITKYHQKYSRKNTMNDMTNIASSSSEIARGQGIYGNSLSLLVSNSVFIVIVVSYSFFSQNYFILFLFFLAIIVSSILIYIQRKFINYLGSQNRKYSAKTSSYAVNLVTKVESHVLNKFRGENINNLGLSLDAWLSSIRSMWFITAITRTTLEVLSLVLVFFLIYKYNDPKIIEAAIIMVRFLPGISAYTQFMNGIGSTQDLKKNIVDYYKLSKKQRLKNKTNNPYGSLDEYVFINKNNSNKIEVVNDFIERVSLKYSGAIRFTGDSGIGKSTVLKSIALKLQREYLNKDQEFVYLSDESVDNYLLLHPLQNYKEMVEKYPLLVELLSDIDINKIIKGEQKLDELSHGQKQRVGFTSVLNLKNSVIALDEFFTGLDSKKLTLIKEILDEIVKDNCVIYINHGERVELKDFKHITMEVVKCI